MGCDTKSIEGLCVGRFRYAVFIKSRLILSNQAAFLFVISIATNCCLSKPKNQALASYFLYPTYPPSGYIPGSSRAKIVEPPMVIESVFGLIYT